MSREQGSRLRDATARECGLLPTHQRLIYCDIYRGDAQ
jgi:hypothetical protein